MWEIAENLHRADLTVLERSEQVTEYARLANENREDVQSPQVAEIEKSKRADGRGHRHASGDSKAAHDLGLTWDEVNRAKKIAEMEPEAKEAAIEAGLDSNQSALLKIAEPPDGFSGVQSCFRDIVQSGKP